MHAQFSVLYPSIAMALLTLGILLYMGACRFMAVQTRKVSIKFYRTYTEGQQTPYLHVLARHVQNHFEVPPLFHLAALTSFVTGTATSTTVAFSWAYVGLRCIHSVIHLTYNNVSHRFFVFASSVGILLTIWLLVLHGLLQQAG